MELVVEESVSIAPQQSIDEIYNESSDQILEDNYAKLIKTSVPTEKFVVDKIVEKPKTQTKISYDAAKLQMLKKSQIFKQQKRILEDSEDEDEESEVEDEPLEKKQKTDYI